MKKIERLRMAMEEIEKNFHNSVFVGQGVLAGGHGMAASLRTVSASRRIELPVFEETQTGLALGLALTYDVVVSIYPRFDFFVSGLSQLLNHSDKIGVMSQERLNPHLIFRVGVGSKIPLDAGPQHTNDYTEALRLMCSETTIIKLNNDDDPLIVFRDIQSKPGVYLVIEPHDLYGVEHV
jgi:pyruvate/2-oxoglutarate/acetoin dehydrogenase E1 component